MSIEIPRYRFASFALRPVLFSGNQEAPFGGETLAVPRIGDRFAVDISTTQLRIDEEGRRFRAALTIATTEDGLVRILQPDLGRFLSSGAPVVDGGGQAGSTINLRGLDRQAALLFGQYLSFRHSGRRYLHMVSAQAIAGEDGRVAVSIWPMLRFITADGDAVDLSDVAIEGQLVGFDKGVTFSRNRAAPVSCTIVERA